MRCYMLRHQLLGTGHTPQHIIATVRQSRPPRSHLAATSLDNSLHTSTHSRDLRAAPRSRLLPTDHNHPTASSTSGQQITDAAPTQWRVYLGRMPLDGFEAVTDAIRGSPAHELLQLHTYVLLEGPRQVWCFDFLPLHPTSPATAAALLTAQSTPGHLRERKLTTTSVRAGGRVTYLGECKHIDALDTVRSFNRSYDTQLHLVRNNCQQYTDALVAVLLSDL